MVQEGDGNRRWLLAAGSFLMVSLQLVACGEIMMGTKHPSCSSNGHCPFGEYCSFPAGFEVGRTKAECDNCGYFPHLPLQVDPATGLVYNTDEEPLAINPSNTMPLPPGGTDWSGEFNVTTLTLLCHGDLATPICGYKVDWGDAGWQTDRPLCVQKRLDVMANWCDKCFRLETGDILLGTVDHYSNLAAMGAGEWCVLLLASVLVAASVVAELRDIELCRLALERADPPPSRGWWWAINLLATVRRHSFLPLFVANIPGVVLNVGSDSLSICFNTIAVLFLAEIDNAAYEFLLDDATRLRVERLGRVELNQDDLSRLAFSKTVHATTVLFVVLPLAYVGGTVDEEWTLLAIPMFWIARIIDDTCTPNPVKSAGTIFATATAAAVFGFVVFVAHVVTMQFAH